MKNKGLNVPKGATHIRIALANGGNKIVTVEDAPTSLIGLDGMLTYMVKTGKKGAADEFSVFAGAPFANPFLKAEVESHAKEEAATETPADKKAKIEAEEAQQAAPAAEAKPKKKASTPKAHNPNNKTNFIISKMDGKLTAQEIAEKVVAKFPEKGSDAAQLAKALRFVRACTWHAKQRGIKDAHYAKAVREKAVKPAKVKKAKTKAVATETVNAATDASPNPAVAPATAPVAA